MQQAIKYFSF
jgi:hypothetical protein